MIGQKINQNRPIRDAGKARTNPIKLTGPKINQNEPKRAAGKAMINPIKFIGKKSIKMGQKRAAGKHGLLSEKNLLDKKSIKTSQ